MFRCYIRLWRVITNISAIFTFIASLCHFYRLGFPSIVDCEGSQNSIHHIKLWTVLLGAWLRKSRWMSQCRNIVTVVIWKKKHFSKNLTGLILGKDESRTECGLCENFNTNEICHFTHRLSKADSRDVSKIWQISPQHLSCFCLAIFPHITTDSQSLTEVYHFICTQLLVLKLW